MSEIAEQRAGGSRGQARPAPSMPPSLRKYVGYLGRIVGVVDDEAGVRYAVAFGDGQIVYFTEEQLAKGAI